MASSLPKDLNKLKVVDLREELDKRGLSIEGLKKDLVDRLHRALDPELAGDAEAPSDVQKAIAQPIVKESDDVQPMLGAEAQEEAISSSADVALMETASPARPTDTETGTVDPARPATPPAGGAKGDTDMAADSVEEAVGHSMVDGPTEVAQEIDDAAAAQVKGDSDVMDTMPAALDDEVAAIVAKEEAKAALPPTPSPPPRASPLPSTSASDKPDVDMTSKPGARKRSASRSVSPEKRRRLSMSTETQGAPKSGGTSTSSNPNEYPAGPSRVLYITNLRRPLLLPSLHELLYPSPSTSSPSASLLPAAQRPFADPDCPDLWLGPIKDHALAVYPSVTAAQEARDRVDGVKWPEDTGAELEVAFMPDEAAMKVAEMQQAAWKSGRQRLQVDIRPVRGDEDKVEVRVRDQAGRPYVMPSAPLSAPTGPKGRPVAGAFAQGPGGMRGQMQAGALGMGMGMGARGGNIGMHNGRPGSMIGPGREGGMGRGYNAPGPAAMGRGSVSTTGGDSYVAGRDAPLSRPARPAQQLPVGSSGPGGGRGGDGRLARPVNMTRARPALVWREGPGATTS